MINVMNEYDFTLTFSLPDQSKVAEDYLDLLYEAGCDDAIIGVGVVGTISLEFVRDGLSAKEVVASALKAVLVAIPNAELIEAKPDLVGLSDVAEILDCSRQNVRKHMVSHRDFPHPAFTGKTSLWHLWELASFKKLSIPSSLVDLSRIIFDLNMDVWKKKSNSNKSVINC